MNVAMGECAGEVVSLADFGFTAAETEAFEAQLLLDDGQFQEADNRAYEAMLKAAHTLVQARVAGRADRPEDRRRGVPQALRRHQDLLASPAREPVQQLPLQPARERPGPALHARHGHKLVEEANLFIDAAHQAHAAWQQKMNVLNKRRATASPLVTA